MNKDQLQQLWEDERHWGDGPLGGYFCKADPRLIVPKRGVPGGTFNLARWAVPILTAIIVLLIVLVLVSPMRAAWKMWAG